MTLRSRWAVPTGIAILALSAVWLTLTAVPSGARTAVDQNARPALPTQIPSSCFVGLKKAVDPASILLGDSVTAALMISATCGISNKPVDLIIVADESNSMLEAPSSGGGSRSTPTPRVPPPPPTREPQQPGWCLAPQVPPPTIGPRVTNTPVSRNTPPPGRSSPTPTTPPRESLGAEDLVGLEKAWVREFLDLPAIQRDMASDRLRVGFVSFNEVARVREPLTNQASKIRSAAGRMRGGDFSRVLAGLREADRLMGVSGSRAVLGDDGRVKVIVLLSDFQFCVQDVRAAASLTNGTEVVTVAFGDLVKFARRNQPDLASRKNYILESQDMVEMRKLYDDLLAPSGTVHIAQMTVRDQLKDNMSYIPGSANPPTMTLAGQLLKWQLAAPLLPTTLTYQVQPLEAGIHPLSVEAGVVFTDTVGLTGSGVFPSVDVEVLAPTETPTPTNTPTDTPTATLTPSPTDTPSPTPTRTPGAKYLPILYHERPAPTRTPTPAPTRCVPEEQTIDVALIIDTSGSMTESTRPGGQRKIDAAVDAAIEIVSLLKPQDQAAVIGFNAIGFTAAQLTGDKAALTAALRSLPSRQAAGTQIDDGLRTALVELESPRHRSTNNRSVILVTDGVQSDGDAQSVRDAALAVRNAGIRVVTVGLGPDVDSALLSEIATSPSLYFRAPDADDLLRIYREVALLIPCP